MKRFVTLSICLVILLIMVSLCGCFEDDSDKNKDKKKDIIDIIDNITDDKNKSIEKTLNVESHKIHSKCEGIIIPSDNQTQIIMEEAIISINPSYWMCMVSNYDFHVSSNFILSNPTETAIDIELAFPFSTHNIFGDHEEQEEFKILIGNESLNYRIALNKDLYSYIEDKNRVNELFYKFDLINHGENSLLTNTSSLFEISPNLYNDGFEMIAFWRMKFYPNEQKDIRIDFTHFSGFGCCYNCTQSGNYFVYNISYAKYWNKPITFEVRVHNKYNPLIITSLNNSGNYFSLYGTNSSKPIGITIYKPPITLEGYIFDYKSSKPIYGAKIELNGTNINDITNESGFYILEIKAVGSYKIKITKEGYLTKEEWIDIESDKKYDFKIEKLND